MSDTTERSRDLADEAAEQASDEHVRAESSESAESAAVPAGERADEARDGGAGPLEAAQTEHAGAQEDTAEDAGACGEKGGQPGLWPIERLKPVLEAVLFAAADAIQIRRICQIIDGATKPEVSQALAHLQSDCEQRGFRLVEVAGGWQFRTAPEHHETVRKLFKDKPQRLTRAQMEVLTIIAYKQPATRAEVEAVRGVDSSSVMEALVERRIVRIAGRRDVVGRPLVYVTTQEFLELFGLKDLRSLPALPELGDDIQTMADRAGFSDDEDGRSAEVLPLEEGDTGEEVQGQPQAGAQEDGRPPAAQARGGDAVGQAQAQEADDQDRSDDEEVGRR